MACWKKVLFFFKQRWFVSLSLRLTSNKYLLVAVLISKHSTHPYRGGVCAVIIIMPIKGEEGVWAS